MNRLPMMIGTSADTYILYSLNMVKVFEKGTIGYKYQREPELKRIRCTVLSILTDYINQMSKAMNLS